MADHSSSYPTIIKSTGIIGGAELISNVFGVIRTKIIAVLLGPAGLGIIGLFLSTLEIIKNITGLGIGFSSIKDIAAVPGSPNKVARSVSILRNWIWFTGSAGMLLAIIFRKLISQITFGSESYSNAIALLSVTILLGTISDGQVGILQGLRRMDKMAKVKIGSSLTALFLALPFLYYYRYDGIVTYLIVISFSALILTWFYEGMEKIKHVKIPLNNTIREGVGMVKLGFFTVLAGLSTLGTMYLVRILISREMGIEAVGIFQAAWSISVMYLASVLNAMSADYFPRLCSENTRPERMNILVNEQTEMVLLISGPVIIIMLSFMNILVPLFFSEKFISAVDILQWQVVGSIPEIIFWPISFILLALGKGKLFIILNIFVNLSYLVITWFMLKVWGLEAVGIAHLFSNLIYLIITLFLVRQLVNFRYSRLSLRYIVVFLILGVLSFLSRYFIASGWEYLIGGLLTGITLIYSWRELNKLFDVKSFLRNLLSRRQKTDY